jgi:very-short-patch-repair endonuclease
MSHAKVTEIHRSRAKKLRQAMTPAETLLWRYIKAHRIDGLGFRRQATIGPYIADFVCHGARLVIELDGESHDFSSQLRHDERRDAWFASQGYLVLRYRNGDVLSNLEGVIEAIRAAAAGRSNLPPSLTLPHKGGGNRGARPGDQK